MTNTRTRILDIAQDAVLAKGFEATSIEEITAAAEITKGGFFYHFADKNALALALVDRYIDDEEALFDDLFGRAAQLSDDPLQTMLIGLKLMAELLENMPEGHPGCLVATSCYQARLFDGQVQQANRRAMLSWRARFLTMFEDIAAQHPPKDKVDLSDLADMLSGVVEGGIILSKAVDDPNATARQVLMFRSYVKILFQP
ncbi:TetR/AcrR family transcriptional regulator [uncultured Litoreibacter sp.]|uniref:TetR/AcrR family transcriptional regulator n=1 Tax=uncultured Litoreibacter sp. TaxID=1392394 RepID=UPI0026262838|nr:TetR/AcrR family transcriptional regulator [uncultured Litoreibacter sp.]